jgi:hypothetical protein
MLHRVVWQKLTGVLEVLAASIIKANTSETLVIFYQTTHRNVLEDNNPPARCHEKLKCHQSYVRCSGTLSSPYIVKTEVQ